jgi:hypothetical protein
MAEMVSQQRDDSDSERGEVTAAVPKCPAARTRDSKPPTSDHTEPLNEVSLVTELAAVRLLLTQHGDSREE